MFPNRYFEKFLIRSKSGKVAILPEIQKLISLILFKTFHWYDIKLTSAKYFSFHWSLFIFQQSVQHECKLCI